jgi:membrane dipeptidase
MHDHPAVFPEDLSQIFAYNRQGRHSTAYEGLSVSYMDAVFDNMMDGTATITSKMGWKWNDVIYDLGMRLSDIAHQDFVIRGEKVADIRYAHETGKIALIPTIEALTPIENEVDRIDVLYGLGFRSMGIVYSESNTLASGLREKRDGGLTSFGYQCVERLDKLGVAIDVSHASDQTSLDTIDASKNPIFMSHTGAQSVWNTRRMMPDSVLQALAEKDGVIGIESAPHTTLSEKNKEHSIYSFMDHVVYCIELMGIDHVGIGPDTLFGDHVGLHKAFAAHLSIKGAHAGIEYPRVPFVKGLDNPAEVFPNVTRWLVTNGYSDAEITKIIGGNAIRILEKIWGG